MPPKFTLEPQNVVTNAMTLAFKLCYPRMFSIPWLSKEKIADYAKLRGWGHNKIKDSLEEKIEHHHDLSKGIHSSYEPLMQWWRNVPEIPERDVYILIPLASTPVGQDEKQFEDFPVKYNKDALDVTKKTTADIKHLLEDLKIADKSYIIVLDEVLFPTPVMPDIYSSQPPEKTYKANLSAIPENLREYFFSHVCISGLIRSVNGTIASMKNFIESAKLENIPIEEKSRYQHLLNDESQFRRDLQIDIRIAEAFSNLQMIHFARSQLHGKFVYLVGSEKEAGCYGNCMSGLPYERINPYEGVADADVKTKIARQGATTSDRSMKMLRSRLEKTYLRKNNGS